MTEKKHTKYDVSRTIWIQDNARPGAEYQDGTRSQGDKTCADCFGKHRAEDYESDHDHGLYPDGCRHRHCE